MAAFCLSWEQTLYLEMMCFIYIYLFVNQLDQKPLFPKAEED